MDMVVEIHVTKLLLLNRASQIMGRDPFGVAKHIGLTNPI